MPPFSGFLLRCSLLGLFAIALKAQALTLGDPLGALHEAPLEPSNTLQCLAEPPNRPLNALDIIDFALCHNPATREVWAQARFNAAQLGKNEGFICHKSMAPLAQLTSIVTIGTIQIIIKSPCPMGRSFVLMNKALSLLHSVGS